jgi:hypothetical protein
MNTKNAVVGPSLTMRCRTPIGMCTAASAGSRRSSPSSRTDTSPETQ